MAHRDSTITVAGNIGGTIELRFTPNGKAVASFSVAHTPDKPDGDGGWKKGETTWFRVEHWGSGAENLANSANADRARVVVVGRLVTEKFEDAKTGEDRTALKLIADEVALSVTYATVDVRKASRGSGPVPVDPHTGETAARRAPAGGAP